RLRCGALQLSERARRVRGRPSGLCAGLCGPSGRLLRRRPPLLSGRTLLGWRLLARWLLAVRLLPARLGLVLPGATDWLRHVLVGRRTVLLLEQPLLHLESRL